MTSEEDAIKKLAIKECAEEVLRAQSLLADNPKRTRIGGNIIRRIAQKAEDKYGLTEKLKHTTIRQTAARYKKRREAEELPLIQDAANDNIPEDRTFTAEAVINPTTDEPATIWSLPKLNEVANEYWNGKKAQLELYAKMLKLHKSTFARHDMGHKAQTGINEKGGVTITHHGSCEVHVVTHEDSVYKSTKFISDLLGDTCMNTLVNDTISNYMKAIHHDLHIAAFVVCPEPNEGVDWQEWEAAMSQLWHIDDGVHQTIVHVTDGPKTEYFHDLPQAIPSGDGTKSPGAAKVVVELLKKLWCDSRLNTDKLVSLNADFWSEDNLDLFFKTILTVLEADYTEQYDSDMWQHIRVLFAIDQNLYDDYKVADKIHWAKTGDATVIDGITIHRGPALNLFRVILLLFSGPKQPLQGSNEKTKQYNGEKQTSQPVIISDLTDILVEPLGAVKLEFVEAWGLYYKFYLKYSQRLEWKDWIEDLVLEDDPLRVKWQNEAKGEWHPKWKGDSTGRARVSTNRYIPGQNRK